MVICRELFRVSKAQVGNRKLKRCEDTRLNVEEPSFAPSPSLQDLCVQRPCECNFCTAWALTLETLAVPNSDLIKPGTPEQALAE
jgi:hypothetical protein